MLRETLLNATQTRTYLFLSFISLIMILGAALGEERTMRLFGRSQKGEKKWRIGALFAHAHYVVGQP
jgi:hypothetical protein